MAHTILGIDLGSSAIKLAQLEAGFRTMRLLALHERPLLPPLIAAEATPGAPPALPEALIDRQMRTLRSLLGELTLRPEVCAAGIGEAAILRVVGLPISDPKKVEQVLPFELEGQLLGEIDEQMVDYTVAQSGLTVEEGQAGQGCRVLAAAVPKREVADLLGRLGAAGLDPRILGATAIAGAALVMTAPPAGAEEDAAQGLPVAVLDLGHHTSHMVFVERRGGRGAALFARTMGRGGAQLTQAIARALHVDADAAEALKRGASVDPQARESQVGVVLREALRPLVRDLRQTQASFLSLYGVGPRQIWLCGGGAQLAGLAALLQNELSVPVGLLPPPALAQDAPPEAVSSCAAALGLALAAAAPAPQVNFRKGEFAYRTDYAFLRERAPHLAIIAMVLLMCGALSALASLRGLQKESEQLSAALQRETIQLFGEPRTDGEAVSSELNSVIATAKGGGQGIPTTSALDLLEEISRAAPQGENKKNPGLDITELNIRPKKTDLKGTAATAKYVDDLAAALGKIACFKSIEQGKTVTVRNTGADGKPVDVRQFSFSIDTTCP